MADRLTRGLRRMARRPPAPAAGERRKDASGALTWEDVFGSARGGDTVDADAALKISAFYRAIDLRAGSIGKYPFSVQNLATRREQTGHYLGPLLWERPNEAMTPAVFKRVVEYQRLVLGNAYVWIYRSGAGRPTELLPLPPGYCEPYVDPASGRLWYIATDPKTGQLYKLSPADILHLKGFSTDGISGVSLLTHAARTMLIAAAQDTYEKSVYESGGRPSGVLYTDTDISGTTTLSDGTEIGYKDLIRREWERIHAGPGNAFRTAVLDNGLKYQSVSMTSSDAQFIESKAVTVEDIARFTGVPLHKLYTGKQSYNSNEANSLDYVVDTIHPAVTQYEEEFTYKLLTVSERTEGKLWITVNMMAELRADSASRGEWYKKMIETGVFSVNDVRRLEDETDVPGGDTHFASLNYVPLELFRELSLARNAPETTNN